MMYKNFEQILKLWVFLSMRYNNHIIKIIIVSFWNGSDNFNGTRTFFFIGLIKSICLNKFLFVYSNSNLLITFPYFPNSFYSYLLAYCRCCSCWCCCHPSCVWERELAFRRFPSPWCSSWPLTVDCSLPTVDCSDRGQCPFGAKWTAWARRASRA